MIFRVMETMKGQDNWHHAMDFMTYEAAQRYIDTMHDRMWTYWYRIEKVWEK